MVVSTGMPLLTGTSPSGEDGLGYPLTWQLFVESLPHRTSNIVLGTETPAQEKRKSLPSQT